MVKASTPPLTDTQSDAPKKQKPVRKATAPKAAAVKPEKVTKPAHPGKASAEKKADAKDGPVIRKKDFVERILEAAGPVNKAQAKQIVDHVLSELAAAIHKGESLILPPLGKLRVTAHTEKDGVPHSTLKVKGVQNEGEKTAKPPLAETTD